MPTDLQYRALTAQLKALEQALLDLLVQVEELNRKAKDDSKKEKT